MSEEFKVKAGLAVCVLLVITFIALMLYQSGPDAYARELARGQASAMVIDALGRLWQSFTVGLLSLIAVIFPIATTIILWKERSKKQ